MDEVDSYLNSLEVPDKVELNRIRDLVRQLVPEATEMMSYGMPGFRYKKRYLLGYAVFKDHYSIFPTPGPVAALKTELKDFKTAKATVQFTAQQPLSDQLLKEIVKSRQTEIDGGAA